MLLVQTHVGPSPIEGLGLFATEPIVAGTAVWRFAPGLDLLLDPALADAHGPAFRAFLDRYAYVSHDFPGRLVLSCDHAKFINHSDAPNIEGRELDSLAVRDIAAGEEITCDYRAISVGFAGF